MDNILKIEKKLKELERRVAKLEGIDAEFEEPTFEEVAEYFNEKGSWLGQAQVFYNYYANNRWRVGKNKMKSWKLAASGWITRDKKKKQMSDGQKAYIMGKMLEEQSQQEFLKLHNK